MSYVRQIQTRGYETDARHRVSIGMLARYFEHVRWEALRDRDAGLASVFSNGGKMVIRAQSVRVLRGLRPREPLDLTLSIARVGKSSIHFVQVAHVDDELVARNDVVAVALDADNRPTSAPSALRERATGESVEPLMPIPEAPATPAFRCAVQIRPGDLDALQHVNHSRYIDYVDDAYQHARWAGVFPSTFSASPAALTIEYERETRIDAQGAERTLDLRAWQASGDTFAFELIDPLDSVRVSRAIIRAA
jgi:acyl-CoA thioesterase FadM